MNADLQRLCKTADTKMRDCGLDPLNWEAEAIVRAVLTELKAAYEDRERNSSPSYMHGVWLRIILQELMG